MSILILPSSLTRFTKGKKEIHTEASTIREALNEIFLDYPELKNSIIDDKGNIRRFVNIYISEKDIRFIENQDSKLKKGDEITIITAVAGG